MSGRALRWIAVLALVLVPVGGTWTFAIAARNGWWFPPAVTTASVEIDRLFYLILWMVGGFFLATQVLLAWFVFRYSRARDDRAQHTHGSPRMELLWTVVPGALLLFIAFAQMQTWADIKFVARAPKDGRWTLAKPLAEVRAAQFEWRFAYPGPDGVLGTIDDVETPFELVVPVDADVVLRLVSRDVIHSFFVPQFRLKQDVVPGRAIPIWFHATQTGTYDLVCAELCGWGHYKMAGRVRVVTGEEYEAWLKALEASWMSNGQEAPH